MYQIKGKENTVLRGHVQKERVSVIPNAVDTNTFTPNPSMRPEHSSEYSYVYIA